MEKTNNFPYFFLVPKAEIKSFLLLDQIEKGIYVNSLGANLRQILSYLFFTCHPNQD